jgi:RNA polymerase sigma factor (sigma-70 family)
MRTDFELLEAWRAGDQTAGSALFERHFDAVFRFFRNKVTAGAEDLVQQTFLACVEARDRFRGDSSFRTYLFAAARNLLFAHYASRARSPEEFDASVTSCADLGVSPSGIVVEQEEHRILLAALRRLPLEMQVALELYFFEQLAGPELATALGVPEGTVRSRIRRGLEILRTKFAELLADPGVESTTSDIEAWAKQLRERVL